MSKPGEIHKIIPKIIQELGPIAKNGFNPDGDYKYRRGDDVYEALNPLFAKHGVFFAPEVLESAEMIVGEEVRVKQKVKYCLYASDGSYFTATVEGEGMDKGDKASNKALTASFKNMATQVFCIKGGATDSETANPTVKNVAKKMNTPTLRSSYEKKANPRVMTENLGRYDEMLRAFRDIGIGEREILQFCKIQSLEKLTAKQYSELERIYDDICSGRRTKRDTFGQPNNAQARAL
jgi:hypothetical protein